MPPARFTVCGLTTNASDAPLFRLPVQPNGKNGLRAVSHLMADKIMTVKRSKLGKQVGVLAPDDMVRLNRAVILF
jgi:mRNA interferase MazF